MRTDTPQTILLKDYRPSAYLIDTVYLDVKLDPSATRIKSKLKMRPNPAHKGASGPLVLDGENITLVSIVLDGVALDGKRCVVGAHSLTVAQVPKTAFMLEIETTCDPEANKALSGLYRSRGVFCTQCEAQGFRRITYFLDRPDVLSTYTVRMEAPTELAPVLLANGNPVERGMLEGGRRRYAVWKDPHPKPSYLFAMVGGNLASIASAFKTRSGRKVDLTIYVEPGKEDRCAWAMDSLKRSMTWDEERFGCEYDLDVFNIVAVSDFNMGAMENKGLNVFNDRLILATAETATDRNFFDIERVVAHEYFHNWTGNRITCRDWFQLCLKEGLTVYRDQEFSGDMHSRPVQRIRDVRMLRAAQFPEDEGPLAHPVRPDRYMEINNFYTATVYNKGAELCRMIATLIGPDMFRRGMDHYLRTFDGTAATVEDFIGSFMRVSGRDFSQFMLWYSQAGTPHVTVAAAYDAKRRVLDLRVDQVQKATPNQAVKKPLHLPLALGLMGRDGRDMALQLKDGASIAGGVLELKKRSETFRFVDVMERPVLSLNRNFSAPIELETKQTDADLAFLLAHDSDPFNRWQAAEAYGMRLLVQATKAIRAGRRPARPTAFITAIRAALLNDQLDPAYRAQLVPLFGQGEVARVIGRNVDPDAIYAAVSGFHRSVAVALGDDLERIYKKFATKGDYAPTGQQAGDRLLRNMAMGLLSHRGTAQDVKRLASHMTRATNATDELAGFSGLCHVRGPQREAALNRYFKRWKDDHLMIDHWFGGQAMAQSRSSLGDVKRLMRHPQFDITNPNKVRSLVFPFAGGNPVNFHRLDGAGYKFVADTVLKLDQINPQMAARLASVFRSWRTLEARRRTLIKAELKRIVTTKPLSRDAFEIVSKTLG